LSCWYRRNRRLRCGLACREKARSAQGYQLAHVCEKAPSAEVHATSSVTRPVTFVVPVMRHTRDEVRTRAQREFDVLDALVRRLSNSDWQLPVPRPETRDPWTVKDALAHITYWKLHTARVFRGERRPPEFRGLDVAAINARIYAEWRDRSPEDVLTWHRDVHDQVLAAIDGRPEEWFGRRERNEYWPGDFDGHSAGHRRKDIEAALGT